MAPTADSLLRRYHLDRDRSRNQHFEEMSRPEVRRARRLSRRLDGIRRDLAEGLTTRTERHRDGYRVTICFAANKAQRVTFLTEEEHTLLLEGGAQLPAPGPPGE